MTLSGKDKMSLIGLMLFCAFPFAFEYVVRAVILEDCTNKGYVKLNGTVIQCSVPLNSK